MPVITRRGVLLPHFERVFSWTDEMKRLHWIIDPDGSLNAWRDGWHYEIIPHNGSGNEERIQWFELTCSTDNCENIRCFSARYLDDAMALATAMAAGIKIK